MPKLMDRHPVTGKFVKGRPVGRELPIPRGTVPVDRPVKPLSTDLLRSSLMSKKG